MITIRTCASEEITKLQKLSDDIFAETDKQYYPDIDPGGATGLDGTAYFTELLTNDEQYCIVADDGGELVGFLAAGPKEDDSKASRYAEVQNMGVLSSYRGQGVGDMLMGDFLKWSKKEGFQKVYLQTHITNTGAIAFYEKNNFKKIEVGMVREIQD